MQKEFETVWFYRTRLDPFIPLYDISDLIQEYLTDEREFENQLCILVQSSRESLRRLHRLMDNTRHEFVIRWCKLVLAFVGHYYFFKAGREIRHRYTLFDVLLMYFSSLHPTVCNRPWCWCRTWLDKSRLLQLRR